MQMGHTTNPKVFMNQQAKDCMLPMGITSENVAKRYNISRLEQDLSTRLGAKVRIQHQQNGRGRLEVHYTSLDELDGVLNKIQ